MSKLFKKIANSKRTKKYLWSLTGRPRFAEAGGVKINLRNSAISDRVARSLYIGEYELLETRIVRSVLKTGDRVLELGAGIGYMSTLCAKRLGGENVFAVEANPEMEPSIRETYRLNNVSPTLEMCVLGAEEGDAIFHVCDNFSSSSVHDRGGRQVVVKQRPLSALLDKVRPSFLICDIEGGEVPLLLDVALDTVEKICIEIHPHIIGDQACSQLMQKFLREGFVCDWRMSGGGVWYLYREQGFSTA